MIADHARLQNPYPTEPFDLYIEILSPADSLRKMVEKCAHYLDWGIGCAWIIESEGRKAYVMRRDSPSPVELGIEDVLTAGASGEMTIPLREVFAEVDKMIGEARE